MTIEPTVAEPEGGGSNGKALAALGLGAFAMANLLLTVAILVLWTDELENTGWWLLPPFLALCTGAIGAFLGSLAWIDVRRGVSDRYLRPAQLGTILGGIAAGVIVAAIVVEIIIFILLVIGLASEGGSS